jgi:hypothetical protein
MAREREAARLAAEAATEPVTMEAQETEAPKAAVSTQADQVVKPKAKATAVSR